MIYHKEYLKPVRFDGLINVNCASNRTGLLKKVHQTEQVVHQTERN